MKTYEYKELKYPSFHSAKMERLNEYGMLGWQMVRYIGTASDANANHVALFMREVQPSD